MEKGNKRENQSKEEGKRGGKHISEELRAGMAERQPHTPVLGGPAGGTAAPRSGGAGQVAVGQWPVGQSWNERR